MQKTQRDFSRLYDLLESQYEWPCHYLFKFVTKTEKKEALLSILEQGSISIKPSKKGNYISISSQTYCQGPDHVIKIYQKVSQLEGVLSL